MLKVRASRRVGGHGLQEMFGFNSPLAGFKVMLKNLTDLHKIVETGMDLCLRNFVFINYYFCHFCYYGSVFVIVVVVVSHFFVIHNFLIKFSLKQMVVCIDPGILTNGQVPEDNILLQKLESLGASHKTQSQLIPGVITWQRACVQHDVQGETLQVQLHAGPSEKGYVTGQKLFLVGGAAIWLVSDKATKLVINGENGKTKLVERWNYLESQEIMSQA